MAVVMEYPPIVIRVKDNRWDAYGMGEQRTQRDNDLLGLLRLMGGINESVEEGLWLFNAVPKPICQIEISLIAIDENDLVLNEKT